MLRVWSIIYSKKHRLRVHATRVYHTEPCPNLPFCSVIDSDSGYGMHVPTSHLVECEEPREEAWPRKGHQRTPG